MWLFWALLVLTHSTGGPSCPWEPFEGLVALMEALGSGNDGTLYTPDSLSVSTLSLPAGPEGAMLLFDVWRGGESQGQTCRPGPEVCPMESLRCFVLELSVIGYEEAPLTGRIVSRLQRSLKALGPHLWGVRGGAVSGPCPICEGHPERPVPQFLAKLLELLQAACAGAHQAG